MKEQSLMGLNFEDFISRGGWVFFGYKAKEKKTKKTGRLSLKMKS